MELSLICPPTESHTLPRAKGRRNDYQVVVFPEELSVCSEYCHTADSVPGDARHGQRDGLP
jgi:hypothetical protein